MKCDRRFAQSHGMSRQSIYAVIFSFDFLSQLRVVLLWNNRRVKVITPDSGIDQ